MERLNEALDGFRAVVGAPNVVTDAAELALAERATIPTRSRVPAIVRPASRAEVQGALAVANRYRVPVYPVSTGKNWAYGSRVPNRSAVLLDLGRMNEITSYDEEHACVEIEPGVTMKQLYDFLQARGGKLIMSPTGSGVDSGLVGNAVERGLAVGPDADRFGSVCGLEVVLPNGDCIHTGYERYERNLLGPLRRYGVGPHFDGLFSQSNLGVVTKLTLWLSKRPRHFQVFLGGFDRAERMAPFIDAFRELYADRTVASPTLVFNGVKGLSLMRQYPWEMTSSTPLPPEVLARATAKTPLSAWNLGGAIYASTREQAAAARARVKRALRGKVDKLLFVDERLERVAGLARRPIQWATGIDIQPYLSKLYSHSRMIGVPGDDNMLQPYWRKRGEVSAQKDPDRDGCGFLCCSPASPFSGEHVTRVIDITTKTFEKYSFEPAISFVPGSSRYLEYVNTIIYDRDVPGEDDRAQRCHDETMTAMFERGYLPYRCGLQAMDLLPPPTDDTAAFIRTLKRTLDPNDILAPGRYDFRDHWPDKGASVDPGGPAELSSV